MVVRVSDYKSSKYVDVFDAFDTLDLSLRYGSDSWLKDHSGRVTTVMPQLIPRVGEVLEALAWGQGNALVKTHCDEAYGVESLTNSLLDTPTEIIEDLITNHINKEFGGAASGYSIADKVETINYPDGGNTFSITHLNSQYLNNFVNVNRVCSLSNAYAQGLGTPEVSIHWFVDPSSNLYVKKIDDDHSDGNWDRYWGGTSGTDPGTRASSTIVVKEDMILYDFRKTVEEYANSIVLSSLLRKPSEDWVTELVAGGTGGSQLWGEGGGGKGLSDDAAAGHFVVGINSVKNITDGAVTNTFYPSGKNAGWNFDSIGSPDTIPTVNFYIYTSALLADIDVHFYKGVSSFYRDITADIASATKWYHISLPIGSYHNFRVGNFEWTVNGAPTWTDLDWFEFEWDGANNDYILIDDFHITGTVVRQARDTSEITAHDLYQKVIRNDTATNDTMLSGTPGTTDLGTAAQLAYAELLRRSQTPTVGMIQIPMAVDLLPGQTVHIHACQKSDDTYRVDADFRVKELTHLIGQGARFGGFETRLNLTSDVTNTHAFAVPNAYSLLMEYAGALGHGEARNLKGGTLDNLIPRLSENY